MHVKFLNWSPPLCYGSHFLCHCSPGWRSKLILRNSNKTSTKYHLRWDLIGSVILGERFILGTMMEQILPARLFFYQIPYKKALNPWLNILLYWNTYQQRLRKTILRTGPIRLVGILACKWFLARQGLYLEGRKFQN